MKNEITYRPATKTDYTMMSELYNRSYNADRDADYYSWLYDHNPMGSGVVFIALLEEVVIGMVGLVSYNFVRNGKEVKTYKSEDALVEKQHRKKGIFKNLYHYVFQYIGIHHLWSFTDKKNIFEKIGRPHSNRFESAVAVGRLVNPSMFNNKRYIKSLLFNLIYLKDKLRRTPKHICDNHQIVDVNTFDYHSLQAFMLSISTNNPDIIYPQISSEIINWRFVNHPEIEEFVLFVTYDNFKNIKALSMVRISKEFAFWPVSYFLDSNSDNDNIAHVKALKSIVLKDMARYIKLWIFDNNYAVLKMKDIFLKSGFTIINDGLWIGTHPTISNINGDNIYYSGQLSVH
ncbi:MAG: GNAT family N-acetyltransferase [Saprospiraceae bacterium]